ncbi:hypothetical protein [Geodermatophilus sp. URMC 65]
MAIGVFVGLQVVAQGSASASTVPNATIESELSVSDSKRDKTIAAECPTGKRVIGGGARVNGAQHVVITQQEPISDSSGELFHASASEDQVGFNGNWSVQAFAICSDPLPGLEIVSEAGTPGSDPFQGISARCLAGKQALGAGGRIDGGQGQVQLGTSVEGGPLFSNRSTATGTEDLDGFDGEWNVTAFTVCVIPNAFGDLRLAQEQFNSGPTNRIIGTVSCPSGTRVTGAAAFTSLPGKVEVAVPTAFRLGVQAIGRSDTPGAGPWHMTVYALCAK